FDDPCYYLDLLLCPTRRASDLVLLCLLTLIWGVNWPVMKIGVADFPPFTFRAVTLLGGLAVLAAIARAQGHSLGLERRWWRETRSEEHTSELQSRENLVCRLLL